MEWLMIIMFIVISIMDSKKKSDQAKQKREQRMQGQPIYRSGDSQPARPQTRPEPKSKPAVKPQVDHRPLEEGTWYESLGGLLKELGDDLAKELELGDESETPKKRPEVAGKDAPSKPVKPRLPKALSKQGAKPASTVKKSPADLPTKTLMEQRPDREKREEHTKVTASVKPLKNAFENDEHCEHRIELNPNIQYSNRKQENDLQRAAIVKTDSESLIQGVIWSEILGKPRAHQPMEQRFRRR